MAFGTLYTRDGNPRTTAIKAVAKSLDLSLDFETVTSSTEASPEYLQLNPLGQVPSFVDSDGFILTECIAISLYMAEQDPNTTLLGKNAKDKATILRWMSFINMEVYGQMGGWFLPLIGRRPYDQQSVALHMLSTDKRIQVLEKQLSKTKFLVGNELSLADIFGCGMIQPGFYMFFDKEWRAQHPNVTRWVKEVYNEPIYQAVAPGPLVMCEKAIPNEPVADPNSYAR